MPLTRRVVGLFVSLWLAAAGGLAAAQATPLSRLEAGHKAPPYPTEFSPRPAPRFSAGASARGTDAEVEQAASLKSLPVITTIAYITAHPDDESGPVISYFARGLGARVVILCMTRGEGGQNTYGPELGEELGRLRTKELEAAARIYGAEVQFLDALDFGYSKSIQETLAKWDERALLERLVRTLRGLKPDVIISRWTPDAPAGAHHQAAGILARQAYPLVGNPAAFPETVGGGLDPWPVRYFLSNASGAEGGENIRIPVEEIDPVAGKSYEEIGLEGVRQHRTQGLDRLQLDRFRGRQYFLRVAAMQPGAPRPHTVHDLVLRLDALPVIYPENRILVTWQERLREAVALGQDAQTTAAAEAAQKLIAGATLLNGLREELQADPGARRIREMIESRQAAFLRAAARAAGIEVAATADRAQLAPGERFRVRLAVKRGAPEVMKNAGLVVGAVELVGHTNWRSKPATSASDGGELVWEWTLTAPESAQPGTVPVEASIEVRAQQRNGKGPLDSAPLGSARGRRGKRALALPFRLPAELRDARGEPVRVVPRVLLAIEPALRLVPTALAGKTLAWELRAERHGEGKHPEVAFEAPPGWRIARASAPQSPSPVRMIFQTRLPKRLGPGRLTVRATSPGVAPAEARVEVVDVSVPPGLRIGYVGFPDDPVPGLLAQLGIGVERLDEAALERGELDAYNAIVVAERAYDFRTDLPEQTPRLLEYVRRGGTLVVEHQSARAWQEHKPAPYPASMLERGNLRVTREDAPVGVLVPDHPILNFPNRIDVEDFNGWVQERGLYFLGQWDAQFTPLLEMADPGEEPLRGGLLYARSGDGVYIYSGLALFRQVRGGVAGGIRLFVNLLSQRRARGRSE